MYTYLFSPIKINGVEIKNRIAYPSLGLLFSYDSRLNDRYYHYFAEKARGGTGMVTVGPVGVDRLGAGIIPLSIAGDDTVPSFKKLTRIIQEEGARAWIQLFHAGAYTYSVLIDGNRALAPSEIYSRYTKETPREMTLEDIKNTQEAFVKAAVRAKEAGFDGVEIIASAGYLITQFLSPVKNLRTDEYGGSFENRIRFPREIIESMRKTLGRDYPISVRMAGNDFVPGSNTDEETPAIARVYEQAGVNLINVTGGWHETRVPQLPMDVPRGAYTYLAFNIKRAVSIPVMASNRISNPDIAEKLIRDGVADMVNLGRVLIADPEWPRKAFEGRTDEIRPCVACNQGCTDTIFSGKPVFCIANPRAGYEGERVVKKTTRPRKIMVIGAGPAGLEAGVTAATAGHRVEIYEKEGEIGGQLWIAGAPPHKNELWEIIRYYKAMIRALNIPVKVNTEVTVETIRESGPDFIIVAEGAEAFYPPVKGLEDEKVLSAWKLLRENTPVGKRVAVIGGGAVGLETALFLAVKGTLTPETLHFLFAHGAEPEYRLRELMFHGSKEVTVFEMLPRAGNDIGRSTRWVVNINLDRYGVEIITGAKVLSVAGAVVDFEREGKKETREYDNVVIAAGSRPVKSISGRIQETGIPYKAVGDCIKPSRLNDAIHGGFLAALEIDTVCSRT